MIVLQKTYDAKVAELETVIKKLEAENKTLAFKVIQYKKKFREEQ